MAESVWKLLHKESPRYRQDCYFGLKDRKGNVMIQSGIWDNDDWMDEYDRHPFFGLWLPENLPMDIFWCDQFSFLSYRSAEDSLRSLLSQPCDRP